MLDNIDADSTVERLFTEPIELQVGASAVTSAYSDLIDMQISP